VAKYKEDIPYLRKYERTKKIKINLLCNKKIIKLNN